MARSSETVGGWHLLLLVGAIYAAILAYCFGPWLRVPGEYTHLAGKENLVALKDGGVLGRIYLRSVYSGIGALGTTYTYATNGGGDITTGAYDYYVLAPDGGIHRRTIEAKYVVVYEDEPASPYVAYYECTTPPDTPFWVRTSCLKGPRIAHFHVPEDSLIVDYQIGATPPTR